MALIALTGASGRIATALRPRLRAAGHRLVLCDAPDAVGDALRDVDPATERVVEADLRDIDAHASAFAGADLVVHLGAHSDERPWDEILAVNIDGTRAVCEAARLAGVGRMLLASSVHAAGYVPVDSPRAREGMPLPAPDTYYGVSKAALEAIGGLYAGRFAMTVVSARIMTFDDRPGGPRSLQSWLSPDDMTRLVLAALTTGVPGHHVVWGVSRNTRRVVDLAPGLAIGFDPQDDAEAHASEVERRDPSRPPGVLGGSFADTAYVLGEPHGGTRPGP
ncbi:NAD(P)-dependent oxidoreductase [Terrabacter carboxydivorans]|uniref:NAD(P)-dependent oxidoreductase n=1 Tax=Terrabacter carboxydivorans TaxID=619730 RepID=A0ABN3MBE5_9MICO